MQENEVIPTHEIYAEKLTQIRDIKFTPREIDVIACIVNSKRPSEIACFLSISKKTVSSYISQINGKIGATSPAQVINFVKESDKFTIIKTEYIPNLYIRIIFEEKLKQFQKIKKESSLCCESNQQTQKNVRPLVAQLKNHLKQSGIHIRGRNTKDYKPIIDLMPDLKSKNIDYAIYIMPRDLVNVLKGDINIKSLKTLVLESSKNSGNIIFFQFEKKIINSISEKSPNHQLILSLERENYYFSFFGLLKIFYPSIGINNLIEEFRKVYKNHFDCDNNFLSNLTNKITYKNFDFFLLLLKKRKKWLWVFSMLGLIFCFVGMFIFNKYKPTRVKEDTGSSGSSASSSPPSEVTVKVDNKFNRSNDVQSVSWNLPRQDHIFVGRKKLLNELYAKLHPASSSYETCLGKEQRDKHELNTLAISAFTGLGGIGKTQLALQYIHHPKHPYSLRAWFPAENIDQLSQKYIEFARTIGYSEEKPSIKEVIIYVKNWLTEHPGWLLVYDNVNIYEEIEPFLPENGGYVILTTRNQNWPVKFKLLSVDIMTEEESINLVKHLTQRDIEKNEKQETKELVSLLGYLPLALAQASAYIQQNQITISEYLDLYKKYEQELLAEGTLPKGTNSLPVATTWNISLASILKESKSHKNPLLSLDLLTACSYMAPETITRQMLVEWLKRVYPDLHSPELVLNKIISQLWSYSLISIDENGDITVHRLLQSIVRYQHQHTLEQKEIYYPKLTSKWYYDLLEAIHTRFCYETQPLKDEIHRRNLLPHLQSLVKHYNSWPDKSTEKSLIHILNDIGIIFYQMDNLISAKSYHVHALRISEEYYGINHIETALILADLAAVYGWLGQSKQHQEILQGILKIFQDHYGKDHPKVAKVLNNLAMTYTDLGNPRYAKSILEEAFKIYIKNYDEKHLEVGNILTNLGVMYLCLGEAQAAKNSLERALSIHEQYYGKTHPKIARTLGDIGRSYIALGNSKQAKELLENALLIFKQHYKDDHPEIAKVLTALGVVYLDLGNPKIAKEFLENSLNIKEKFYNNPDHQQMARTLINLSAVHLILKNNKLAIELLNKALKIFRQDYGNDHSHVATALTLLANANMVIGNTNQAKHQLETALKIKKQFYGETHPEVAMTLFYLGEINIKLKEFILANSLIDQCHSIFLQAYGENDKYTENAMILKKLLTDVSSQQKIKEYFKNRSLLLRQLSSF